MLMVWTVIPLLSHCKLSAKCTLLHHCAQWLLSDVKSSVCSAELLSCLLRSGRSSARLICVPAQRRVVKHCFVCRSPWGWRRTNTDERLGETWPYRYLFIPETRGISLGWFQVVIHPISYTHVFKSTAVETFKMSKCNKWFYDFYRFYLSHLSWFTNVLGNWGNNSCSQSSGLKVDDQGIYLLSKTLSVRWFGDLF